ncbi:putative polysaccharide biosynthesis protein [Bacillus piscicola]|uniref:putative polysaccharide biosynthesis protein n=1 Tax=Bacillus piscicola TaxID=1632684 RepID=UPI001F0985EF|nr:polysaccharide biosynthesis protein [Bacillus piscicola]
MSNAALRSKSLWKGALFVSAAAFLGKILSALYRVPYQNMTGDIGYYVYQQIYPFYGAAMVTAMYGFPVIISKMVLETERVAGEKAAKDKAWSAFFLLLLIHIPLFLLLFLGAPIAAEIMGDRQLTTSLRVISLVFLFVPVYSATRGYFQGMGNMNPTALSHLLEQLVRVTVILTLAWLVIYTGKDVYAAGLAAAVGSIAGSVAGVSYLIWYITQHRKKQPSSVDWQRVLHSIKTEKTALLVPGFLICAGTMVFILYQLIDAFTLAKLLEESGVTAQQAKELKGLFDRGQPLLQFGTVVASSLAMTVVPLISREKQAGNVQMSQSYAALAVRVSVLVGFASALGLNLIAQPVNVFLYEDANGTELLQILAITLAVSGPVMVTSAVMQGHDCYARPVVHLFIGWCVKLAGNISLIPVFGAKAAATATVAGMLITALCNGIFLYKRQWLESFSLLWMGKAVLALAGMAFAACALLEMFETILSETRTAAAISSLLTVFVSSILFLGMVVLLRLFTREERRMLPVLQKIEGLWKRKEK